jgi:hypothetical protein
VICTDALGVPSVQGRPDPQQLAVEELFSGKEMARKNRGVFERGLQLFMND